MFRYFIAAVIGSYLMSSAGAQESFLCITEASAGLSFDEQSHKWSPASFGAGKKFIFRQKKDQDNATMPWAWTWALFPFGSTQQWATCGVDSEVSDYIRECHGIYDLIFNRNTLRFQIYYKFGFAYPSATKLGASLAPENSEGNDTPYIAIGTCSLL